MSTSPTPSPTPAETSTATAIPILEFGRAWMQDPGTPARAAELGLTHPFAFWALGRAGSLGDITHEGAAAAIGFMAPHLVAEVWSQRAGRSPRDFALEYAAVSAAWGRSVLADVDPVRLERLRELSNRVAAATPASVGALFAGWRSIPQPTDPAGGVTVALNVLREMRGGAHLAAVHAAGLTPHHAVISFTADQVRGGPAGAERFGWQTPHPEPDEAARARAEELTTLICTPSFAALDGGERAEFIELVREVRAALAS